MIKYKNVLGKCCSYFANVAAADINDLSWSAFVEWLTDKSTLKRSEYQDHCRKLPLGNLQHALSRIKIFSLQFS